MEEKHNNDPEILEGGGEEPKAEQHPMAALMEDALAFRAPKPGDIVEGEIVSVSPTEVLVDVELAEDACAHGGQHTPDGCPAGSSGCGLERAVRDADRFGRCPLYTSPSPRAP